MNVVVAIPWRSTPEREAAKQFCTSWWKSALPDAHIIEVDTQHQEYNLAAARNLGVRRAQWEFDADVVVLPDADVVISPVSEVVDAVEGAHSSGMLHMPFTNQRYLTQAETESLFSGGPIEFDGGHLGNGACYAVKPSVYWSFGGSDERFSGWGGEDDGLVAAASTFVGLRRHSGVAYSLWHADEFRDVGSVRHQPNSRLAQRYWKAKGKKPAMQQIIDERDY